MIGIHGIEWTTYHGHMLVLGEQGYTDWRGVGVQELELPWTESMLMGGLSGLHTLIRFPIRSTPGIAGNLRCRTGIK